MASACHERRLAEEAPAGSGTAKIYKDLENQHLKKLKVDKVSSQKHTHLIISDPKIFCCIFSDFYVFATDMTPNPGTKDAERVLRTILKDFSESKSS